MIVPDSFKGSLSSRQAADAIAEGIIDPKFNVEKILMADGGEGTVDSFIFAQGGTKISDLVSNPIGRKIKVEFGVLKNSKTTIIEIAAASGLTLIPPEKRNPLYTTTYGTGELIRKIIERGFTKIIVGLGGSATVDCGAGAMQALGIKLLDKNGKDIRSGGLYLKDLHKIDAAILKEYKNIEVTFLYDVNNKLLGSNGAAEVYSQQKGASKEEVQILKDNLEHFSKILYEQTGINISGFEGSGAAGGLAAGLSLLFKSRFVSGSEFLINSANLKTKIQNADIIITGEGELNFQTKYGKIPYKIAEICKEYKKSLIGIFGDIAIGANVEYKRAFKHIYSLCENGIPKEKAMQNAYILLVEKVKQIFAEHKFN
ncbi:MAG: glycerate kinase [Candidatus Tenebribacter davisii]|nr:glycerate kinase [Candidatus Tenebribacter davisii]